MILIAEQYVINIMPSSTGRAFTTANLLVNLAALKAINFGSSDPAGVWFVVPNSATNNVEIWIWQPDSVLATDEISVVRPDSIVPGSPGRCIQRLKFDASLLGGILGAINALNTAGIIERTAQGGAATVTLSSYMRGLLDDTSDSAARATLGLNFVNNTSDANKPVSSQQQSALDLKADLSALNSKADVSALGLKANLASPTFTGTPAVPTATAGTNTTQAASTAFVSTAVANLVSSSPAALDTLNELAAALGNDANFSTTINTALANRVDVSTNQNIGGRKYLTESISVGVNSSLSIQPYNNSNIQSLNSILGLNLFSGSFTGTSNIASTFTFNNVDVEINSLSTNTFGLTLGQQLRIRNFGTGSIATLQGGRFTALNSSTGTITTQDGGYFLARNDSTGIVTTLSGGNFFAQSVAGTVTNINGGLFTASASASSTSTTIRGIQIVASSSNTTPATDCVGLDINNITGTAINKYAIRTGIGQVYFGDTTQSTSFTNGSFVIVGGMGIGGNIFSNGFVQGTQFQIAGTKVVGAREMGWTAGTGTPNKSGFAADTATLLQVAQRLLATEQTLRTHGLIN